MRLKTKHIFGILFSLALVLGSMGAMCTSAYADDVVEYSLWINDTQVTESNKDNVLAGDTDNDGKVSFTPAEGDDPAKLTLKGAKITRTYNNKGIYYNGEDPLIIELKSGTENSVICVDSFQDAIVFTNGNITITGKGKLTAKGSSNGINAEMDGPLTIDGSDVKVEGNGYGIQTKNDLTIKSGTLNVSGDGNPGVGIYCKGKINIYDGNITAVGRDSAIKTFTADNVTLGKGVTVKAGDNEASAVDVTNTFEEEYDKYKWVQTKEVPKYPLWIGDTQVTSVNHSGPSWFYNIDTKTLRLYGSDYGSGEYDDGGVTVDYGVRCAMTDLTINVLTDSTVEGSGIGDYSYGIFAPGCNLNIIGDGKLTAEGGSGTGDGSKGFTAGIKAETANVKGKLECLGGYSTKGISASRGIEVQKVNVGGELTAKGIGYGIYRSTDGVTIEKGSKAEIIGEISCIAHGIVKNAILGTGWTNTEGTEGAALIKVGNTGHDLSNFKKALFPTEADPATVIAKPTGKNLTYNGSAQELVTAGKAENGEMQYAIGKDKETAPTSGWSTSIPKGTKAGTYYVWYKAVGDKMHIDSEAACVTATIKEAPKPTPTPTPTPTKVSGMLMTKMKAKGKTGMTISWNKIKNADGYDIFFARCNHSHKKIVCKKVKNIKGNNIFKWKKSGLKKGIAYKSYIKAYVYKDGRKKYVFTSPVMHAYTGNGNKKYTNAKSVSLKNIKKGKLTLKKGKSFKIKAKVNKVNKKKKLTSKKHAPALRYMSSSKKIATVSKSGKIKAKGKGKCYVYAYAHNGVSKKITVKVK